MPTYQRREIGTGEAARILGISRQKVQRMIDRGTLVPLGLTPDGIWVLDRVDVEQKRCEHDATRKQDHESGYAHAENGT
jgi:hypothetical protein